MQKSQLFSNRKIFNFEYQYPINTRDLNLDPITFIQQSNRANNKKFRIKYQRITTLSRKCRIFRYLEQNTRLSSYTRAGKQLYFIRRATTFPQIVAGFTGKPCPLNHRGCTEAFRCCVKRQYVETTTEGEPRDSIIHQTIRREGGGVFRGMVCSLE